MHSGGTEVVIIDNIILALTAEVPFCRATGIGNENNKPHGEIYYLCCDLHFSRWQSILKSFTSLTYNCTYEQQGLLMEVNSKLHNLMGEFQSRLPHKEGLLLRPELRKTLKISQQKKLAVAKASQLQSTLKCGRKRADVSYRNRVGKKAQALRKVS